MLPLSTSTRLLYWRNTNRPSRLIPDASVVFVEPMVGPSQPLQNVWNQEQINIHPPFYPPCEFDVQYKPQMIPTSYPVDVCMDVAYNTPPSIYTTVPEPNIPIVDVATSQQQIFQEIYRECEPLRLSPSAASSSPATLDDFSDDSDSLPTFTGKTPEKRARKKAQNREAATRYREKKRKEREEAKAVVDGLLSINSDLKNKIGSIQTEIDYLKRLMKEIGMTEEHLQYISPVVPL